MSSNLAKTILENVKPTDEAEPLESVETFAEKISSSNYNLNSFSIFCTYSDLATFNYLSFFSFSYQET